jgi:hypothetical protein
LQPLPYIQEELQQLAFVTRDLPLGHAVTAYHVVAPVSHCLFQVIRAAIRFAKALKSFDAKQPLLFLFGDAAHSTTQGCGHGEIRFKVAQQLLVILVENGNLYVDQKSQLLAEGCQGFVSICGMISNWNRINSSRGAHL